ncbi:FAT domain-containing protein [Chytridium lagenaria]|nr:FAT domain-containing protein [Chytridium lagenaria]
MGNDRSDVIFAGVRAARTDAQRLKTAKELRDHVTLVSREISGDPFTKFMSDVHRRIYELVNGDVNDKLGALACIECGVDVGVDQLVDVEGEETEARITRFANYLRVLIGSADGKVCGEGARVLGRLALHGGTLTADFTDFEAKRALEWLQGDRGDVRRYAGVLVLRELCWATPGLMHNYVGTMMSVVWVALRDPKVMIREAAAQALGAFLEIVKSKEELGGEFGRLWNMVVEPRYRDIQDVILKFKDHRDSGVRRTVVALCSALAGVQRGFVGEGFLKEVMGYLVYEMGREDARDVAFIAIGKISLAVRASIIPYIPTIMTGIQTAFLARTTRRLRLASLSDPAPIYQCIRELGRYLPGLLDEMFGGGLSRALKEALVVLEREVEGIQGAVLDMLCIELCGEPYHHPGAPLPLKSEPTTATLVKDPQNRDVDAIVLALECFGGEQIRRCIVKYLQDVEPRIRKAAAETCCYIIGDVLDFNIRQAVLSSLDERFDSLLVHPESLRGLFVAFNDEILEIRELAITLISRESARLLGLVILGAPDITRYHVRPVAKVVLDKIKDPNVRVAARSLMAVGELFNVGGDAMADRGSSTKREAALCCLGRVVQGTGEVVKPYLEYPTLMGLLVNMLKSEQSPTLRLEAAKVIGTLGALDPYRYKLISAPTSVQASTSGEVESRRFNFTPAAEEYYPTVVIEALMRILRDATLSAYHPAVIEAVTNFFKGFGLKGVPFLPTIMPVFLTMMRSTPTDMLDFHLKQLAFIISTAKHHIRNYLPDVFALIEEFWQLNTGVQISILSVIESIAAVTLIDFKRYLPTVFPRLLEIFENDTNDKRLATQKVLSVLLVIGENLEDYLYLVIPCIVRLFVRPDVPIVLRKQAITFVGNLCIRVISFDDQASRVVHPLVRLLGEGPEELFGAIVDTLCVLLCHIGPDFLVFVPVIEKALKGKKGSYQRYTSLVDKLERGESIPKRSSEQRLISGDESTVVDASTKPHPVNALQLKKAWEASETFTKDDWSEWIRRFSAELLKESPSYAFRACAALAGVYPPLARELFNSGFFSCWVELQDDSKADLVACLEIALNSHAVSPETVQMVLDLAEYMDRIDASLPIAIDKLAGFAQKCQAYAKALNYQEKLFVKDPSSQTIEALISINTMLQLPDSAIGALVCAKEMQRDVGLDAVWYEKLQRWEDGLAAYDRRQEDDPGSVEAAMGRIRCLHNLGEWEALIKLADERLPSFGSEGKRRIAPLAAAAAWGLERWDLMKDYTETMVQESPDGSFFRAVLALHLNRYSDASENIGKTRELLDKELMALVGESYSRAYPVLVRAQMLVELEEIINFKKSSERREKLPALKKMWMNRLKGCQRNVEVWQRTLRVRALVLSPREDSVMWIKFANLCRKSGRLLSNQARDLGVLDMLNNPPNVIYACLKHTWASGVRDHALNQMRDLTNMMVDTLGITTMSDIVTQVEQSRNDPRKTGLLRLLARCYLKLGDWQSGLQEELNENAIPEILRSYSAATCCDKDWYKAWHRWAMANFKALSYFEAQSETVPAQVLITYLVPSLHGFFQSIALSKYSSLQDTLRLLTLWFKYASRQEVNMAVGDGLKRVTLDTWLQVIPQLIARIHESHPQELIHQILTNVGKYHPQALVFSLTVASKSPVAARKEAAIKIMEKIQVHSASLVEQHEILRLWYEGLEDASRYYYQDRNPVKMMSTLTPLQHLLDQGPSTRSEEEFVREFAGDLVLAYEFCSRPNAVMPICLTLNTICLWFVLRTGFPKASSILPKLTQIELRHVSPRLLAARDLQIAVPGTYKSGEPVIGIGSFSPSLSVFSSKQRPRKLVIRGSNGTDYQFLLKGHEDLRQDERVMQLFGLVNTLLSDDHETFKRHLDIERYAVIPLSPKLWEYRESFGILLNIEHRLMLEIAPDYDNLTLLQKVEVFEAALSQVSGNDLKKITWLKSKNSEVWLDRRTNYTRSLAVMSMVGYILGLGDRHPSNLMMDRLSGKIVHIDFGDCFEVAMHREKFPEKVPFRLTRMLIKAMEVSGIEGNFRITSEHVMRVLRENKDSVMAVLEAFVYDPLLNWRLLHTLAQILGTPVSMRGMEHEDRSGRPEGLNSKAISVLNRVSNKLSGRDFRTPNALDVSSQVQRLILQATSIENLCPSYIGWPKRKTNPEDDGDHQPKRVSTRIAAQSKATTDKSAAVAKPKPVKKVAASKAKLEKKPAAEKQAADKEEKEEEKEEGKEEEKEEEKDEEKEEEEMKEEGKKETKKATSKETSEAKAQSSALSVFIERQ